MSTRIRLQRHGKKGKPFFHIVVADSRSKRDGRYIEKLGTYNPNTNPATIDIDFDRSVHWVGTGAELSDTARAIMSYKGVLMKEHLKRGVTKGALTEDQMEAKYTKWLEEKEGRIQGKVDSLSKSKADAEKARLAAEKEVSDARAAALAAAAQPEEAPVEEGTAEAPATEQVAEAASEAGEAVAEAVEEAVETVKEVVEEVKEVVEEVVKGDDAAEVKEEVPAEEAKTEEAAPAEEKPAEEANADSGEEAAEEKKKEE